MKAEIKRIELVDGIFETFCPDDIESYCIAVAVEIGPENADGGDTYSLTVSSKRWLSEHYREPIFCRHLLIVDEYDPQEIKAQISRVVSDVERSSWRELAEYFSRFFKWEFEDYCEENSYKPAFPYSLPLPLSET